MWSTGVQGTQGHPDRNTLTALPRASWDTQGGKARPGGVLQFNNVIVPLVPGDFCVWNKQGSHQTEVLVTQGLGAMLVNRLG